MASANGAVAIPTPTATEAMTPSKELTLYNEPLDTPGVIPKHLKRAATAEFPLFEILQRLLFRLHPGNAGSDLEKVLAIIALYRAAAPAYRHLTNFVTWACTSQVTIPEYDPVAREVSAWMAAHVISKSVMTRGAMIVSSNAMEQAGSINMFHQMIAQNNGNETQNSDETQCLPPIGKRIFWVGFRPFLFSRSGISQNHHLPGGGMHNVLDAEGQVQNAITLRTIGWSLQPLKDFIKKCHDFKLQNRTGTTTVYFSSGSSRDPYRGGEWSSVVKAVRKLDTIDMDDDLKADLVHDAEYYYSTESQRFFADCGIPYRRGYMFWGPPGTGKTSFSAALAGHLNCDVYIINLATGDISDGRLHRLFLALPRKCVVVIEDIDSAGIGREQGPGEAPKPLDAENANGSLGLSAGILSQPGMTMPGGRPSRSRRKRNMVTLSGLLNAIDGNASAEGRLLIMTSNNPDTLDEALTRPGRIDKKVCFGKLMPAAARGIFKRLIGRAAIATLGFTEEQIEEFATEFSGKVPADTFTPAQVQNFLHSCRGDPEKAMREIDAWVVETRGKKPKKEGGLVPPTQGMEVEELEMLSSEVDSDEY